MSFDDRVVLRIDFGHNNFCQRPLVKDNASVGASKHREQRVGVQHPIRLEQGTYAIGPLPAINTSAGITLASETLWAMFLVSFSRNCFSKMAASAWGKKRGISRIRLRRFFQAQETGVLMTVGVVHPLFKLHCITARSHIRISVAPYRSKMKFVTANE